MAELVSVNVGLPRHVDTPRGPVLTAIFKSPTDERLRVVRHNLEGDQQADLSVHGGENKAVYGYPSEHYPTWADELGRSDLVLDVGRRSQSLHPDHCLWVHHHSPR